MGGTGNRLMDCQQDVVKRNLVKRWVMAKASEPEKIHIRTRKDAELFKGAFRDAVLLGVIQVDVNTKQVKWVQTATVDLRSMNPLEGKFELVT
jgi:CDP-glycerol glycerophosphotransferase (TagB/SpsB family)